jgi:predicted benzoate:H+ symporter BenE
MSINNSLGAGRSFSATPTSTFQKQLSMSTNPSSDTPSNPGTPAKTFPGKNSFNRMEWAGAFGDLGTLIPFVIAYITLLKMDPLGILFSFGLCMIAAGFYYRTPIPIQPMKAIGTSAITHAASITPAMVIGAGLATSLFWLILGLTNTITWITRLATKPIVHGIVLGLGLSFILHGVKMMDSDWPLASLALLVTFLLLSNPKIPAMAVLLLLGIAAHAINSHDFWQELAQIHIGFRMPSFSLTQLTWKDFISGAVLLAIPQLPLTLGNAVIAMTDENNQLFPDRPVTARKLAVSHGLINALSAPLAGIPLCHGAGGMAGHVRFGARTGGALIILGGILLVVALFFSDSVEIILKVFPEAVLGVILFFAGAELARGIKDLSAEKGEIYVMVVVAGFALWNMGAAFLVGLILDFALRRGWVKV